MLQLTQLFRSLFRVASFFPRAPVCVTECRGIARLSLAAVKNLVKIQVNQRQQHHGIEYK